MTFRTATRHEMDLILSWAAEEGWNPGLEDAGAFYDSDPQGFFVAEVNGAPVAAISVVNHDPANAFLGLYICRPEWRGQGIGFALWTHAIRHAGPRSIGLDGVAAQQANYAKSGFALIGATQRWEGELAAKGDAAVRIRRDEDLPRLFELDRVANGYDRPAFLRAWLARAETRQTYVLSDGVIAGFATARRCRNGCKIGPIIAPDSETALVLARAALHGMGETQAIIDLPETNEDLRRRLMAEGFVNSFTTARMVRGPTPKTGPALQAIATMELG
ncbi:GNAT family N-acetyltransferase [Tabrizicola sp. J26]|uniref:GNAT family N-acetyltransferase n=1 Tax=Alitabrizicola rongguiensis TaxID=2909234 RepID=UPI001F1B448B|nr:GNAT family N-acetyltransferase [Tabrizicola rongguiensis]MCF1710594.1 GNAT family N-acetyltransferase [Tabrizicola rongguiensis]